MEHNKKATREQAAFLSILSKYQAIEKMDLLKIYC